ncbi:hypothetical protein T265_09289 [Opisthorchis viverrini]|uniref:Uncharacterized protein n=1 Tax=Opisthorchis viverrini TaxID=6198 RepID=A0A074Z6B4_OPIVI|nr:hypothetical protein T265_09289 [Opisthorchis viverrini]KER22666.1 hypothetical protein T265_09289 [Opisthorchis viverrini]
MTTAVLKAPNPELGSKDRVRENVEFLIQSEGLNLNYCCLADKKRQKRGLSTQHAFVPARKELLNFWTAIKQSGQLKKTVKNGPMNKAYHI